MSRSLIAAVFSLVSCAFLLPSCAWDGHFTLLGYSTQPNYDTCYKTIRVPIFKTRVNLQTTPVPGLEQDLTEAIISRIQLSTPYKIDQGNADTELTGTIVSFSKNLINYTQFNTVREAETVLVVSLIWRDLKTGKILTRARPTGRGNPCRSTRDSRSCRTTRLAGASALPDGLMPGTKPIAIPSAPHRSTTGDIGPGVASNEFAIIDPLTREKAVPIQLRSIGHFKPELGESITTALQQNIDKMSVQIVSVMEKGW